MRDPAGDASRLVPHYSPGKGRPKSLQPVTDDRGLIVTINLIY
jgi:hypothetical protein